MTTAYRDARARRRSSAVSGRFRIDRFDLLVLAVFAAVAVWIVGLDAWQVIAHGRAWTGTDGVLPEDQMQYLAWIRAVSEHGLASDLFVLHATPADYFQPAIEISGALAALGVAPWVALLLWKPVAVAAVFFTVRAYVHGSLAGRWSRRAALVLALFFGFFGVGAMPDLWAGFWTWGYPFEVLSLAAMVGALLAYQRAWAANRASLGAPLLGALASSVHPWEGMTLIVVIVAATAATWSRRTPLRLPIGTVLATAIPLCYYGVLGRTDAAWRLADEVSQRSASLWRVALALAPLAVPAAFAYRVRPRSFLATATRAWPVAALAVFLLCETSLGATPLHAFAGISVPLAVLAVEGVGVLAGWPVAPGRRGGGAVAPGCRGGGAVAPRGRGAVAPGRRGRAAVAVRGRGLLGRRGRALLAAVAIAALTIPATVSELSSASRLVTPTAGDPNFITPSERDALAFLARDREAGGVLTRFYLGAIVPAETGRNTFVGNCYWSQPDCPGRAVRAEQLLDGTLSPGAARAFVRSTGARFVLSDCASRADLVELLGPLVRSVRRFGCAGVYVLWRH